MELLGILLPIIIDLFNRKIANKDVRFWLSVVLCSVVGVFINYVETQFNFTDLQAAFESITGSIMVVFGWAQLSYKVAYEHSSLQTLVRKDQPASLKENPPKE